MNTTTSDLDPCCWELDPSMMEYVKLTIDDLDPAMFGSLAVRLYRKFGPFLSLSQTARDQYAGIFDYWGEHRAKDIPKSLLQRLDSRSLGDFAIRMHNNGVREWPIMQCWLRDNALKHWDEECTLMGNAITDEGCVLFGGKHKNFKRADFYLSGPDVRLELKLDPCTHKATYKKGDLEDYVRQNATMLTIFLDNIKAEQIPLGDIRDMDWSSIVGFYTLMTPEDMQRLMYEVKVKTIYEEVGKKPGYQLFDGDEPEDKPTGKWERGLLTHYGTMHKWG